jgi:hypothetical protein
LNRISDRQETNDFLDQLFALKAYDIWNGNRMASEVIDYILSIDNNSLIRIVSDKIWDRYYSYKTRHLAVITVESAQYHYGEVLQIVFSEIISFNPNIQSILIKHGEGILLRTALKTPGVNSDDVFSRASVSKDSRVRTAVASICNIDQLAMFKNDLSGSVRRVVVSRLGIKNCYKDFINDKVKYLRYISYVETDLSEFDYKGILDSYMSKKVPVRHMDSKLIINIIKKMDKKEIPFYIFLSSNNLDIKRAIEWKLNS